MRRQAKGASLEAVVRATRVARTVLIALEEDRFDDLPAPVYVRGFLRLYAQYLEVEPDQVLQAYEAQVAVRQAVVEDAPAPTGTPDMPDYLRETETRAKPLNAASGLMLVAIAAIALIFLWSVNRKGKPNAPRPDVAATAPARTANPSAQAVPGGASAAIAPGTTVEPLRARKIESGLPPLPGQAGSGKGQADLR